MSQSPAKTIANLLRAGAILIVYQDSDEALAISEAMAGADACGPVTVMSGADDNALVQVEALPSASARGTLILLDFLSIAGQNPVAVRLLRQVALQQRPEGSPFTRLILIERPETDVPVALAGDAEVIRPKLPTIEELREELDAFCEMQPSVTPEGNGEQLYAIAAAGAGLARHEYSRLLARSVIEQGQLDAAWIRQEKAKRVAVKLSGALTFESPDAADVGGLEIARAWLEERKAAFASKAAREFGLPEPKGMLAVGPPGTGKSLLAKLVARMWGLPLLRLDAGKLYGSLVGQSESNARLAIEAAEACAPCVLWIDEIEKALAGASGPSGDSGTSQRIYGALLTWMQEKQSAVFVMATANDAWTLPAPVLRKGRFDEIFMVGLPTQSEREAILRIHLERRKRQLDDAWLVSLASYAEGFVGAEIEQAVISGLFAAFAAKRELQPEDVQRAIEATVPISKTAPEEIKRIEDWGKGRARAASLPEETTSRARSTRRPAMMKGA